MIEPPLQPLRIPAGWTIEYTKFLEIDPCDVPEDYVYFYLDEDLLQIKHHRLDRLLDVGWYPSGNVSEGSYGLVVYQGDFHGKLLAEFRSADRRVLIAELERLLVEVAEGRL